jgi:uncharacterized damage-inducible protein DinB
MTAELAHQLQTVIEGNAWHGPAVLELLADVDARRAAKVPAGSRHSIWELVLHIDVWLDAVRRRVTGDPARIDDPAADFPPPESPDDAAWAAAKDQLRETADALRSTMLSLTPADLDGSVVGQTYSLGFMLHGAIQHVTYHAGQIALLKRM